MKKVLGIVLLSWFCIQTAYAQEAVRLADDVVPFVYESRALIPTSSANLASFLSDEYRNAPDEFTKHDLLEKIKPIIDSKLKEAKANSEYVLRIGTKLGQYDFDKKQFPSGFSETTFIPFENKYAVQFENAKAISNIPLALDAAKSLSEKLQRSRAVTAVVYCRVVSAKEKKLTYYVSKVINAYATKVEFLSGDGTTIATITPLPSK